MADDSPKAPSEMETEILSLLCQGRSPAEVSILFGIENAEVTRTIAGLKQRFEAATYAELIGKALRFKRQGDAGDGPAV
jgi:DNA-binding CsgD family transcriptional regulator